MPPREQAANMEFKTFVLYDGNLHHVTVTGFDLDYIKPYSMHSDFVFQTAVIVCVCVTNVTRAKLMQNFCVSIEVVINENIDLPRQEITYDWNIPIYMYIIIFFSHNISLSLLVAIL